MRNSKAQRERKKNEGGNRINERINEERCEKIKQKGKKLKNKNRK